MSRPWRAALLALTAALIWCWHHERWTTEQWQLPTAYQGDAPEVLAEIKAASEGELWPLVPKVVERLGAPFGAHWNGYPTPDKPVLILTGAFARIIGLFPAANLAQLMGVVMAALAFYFVARWLRCRWEWAWAGALLFAFNYQAFHRGLGHFSISLIWAVPPGLLAVWLVARSRRLTWRSPGAVVCLATSAAMGAGNPYYLLFWGQLMVWALAGQWLDGRRRENLTIGMASLGVAAAVLFISTAEVWLYVQEPEGAPLLERNYSGTEIYALKPVEMLIPPTMHRSDLLASLGHRYVRWSVWRGEGFLPYLGFAGIAALAWLCAATVRRALSRRPVPGQALSVGWLVAYASVGGVTNVLALFAGFQMFRATNRVVVFVAAILLTFLVLRLSRLTARWPAWSRAGCAFGLAALGVLDQVPRRALPEERAAIAATARADLELGRALEARLPPGAMVFQLPVLGFPEVAPPYQLDDYDLFRPYLVTDRLRFSYGAAKHRARSQWQHDLARLPARELVRRLEAHGFSALHINRRGFGDGAAGLLAALRDLGYPPGLTGAQGHQVVVFLRPKPSAVAPLGRDLTFGRGWHPPLPDGMRWANRDAVLSYFNPHDDPLVVDLRLSLAAPAERDIELQHEGRTIGAVHVGEEPAALHVPGLALHPGVNVLLLRSSAPAIRVSTGQYALRKFGLHETGFTIVSKVSRVE